MNTFEDRLLTELVQRVAANPGPAARRPRRGRLVLAGTGGTAVVAAAAAVALSGGASAYAVESSGNGSVTVHIRDLSDASGLQRELRAAGVPAVVKYGAAEPGCGPGVPPGAAAGAPTHTYETPPAAGITKQTGAAPRAVEGGPSTDEAGTPPVGERKFKTTTSLRRTDDGVVFTIDPGVLGKDDHVYITTTTGSVDSVGMAVCPGAAG